jgi:hypothetical protein
MPIQLACACGRQFKVADEHAGRRVKCPACGVIHAIPTPEEDPGFEVVEDEPPEAVGAVPAGAPDSAPGGTKGKRKRSRRRPPAGEDGPLARMYMEQAREEQRRDEARARAAGNWGRDEGGHGWTMFGVHITAGVVGGAGMFLIGLLAMAVIAFFKDDEVIRPKVFIAAIVCTAVGAITLLKSLFFGEED